MTNLRTAVFTVLDGWTLPPDARKILETAYYAQPEQEPVAWVSESESTKQFVEGRPRRVWWECNTGVGQPLYTAPPKREWVGLSETEIRGCTCECVDNGTFTMACAIDFARAVETTLKDRNTTNQ